MTPDGDVAISPYEALASSEGAALLSALEGFDEEHAAAAAQRARSLASPDLARAALATSFARRRAEASGKFEHPRSMFFTRAGYEQATSDAVARYRAERFAGLELVADLCCGIGSDSVALARRADSVDAFDVDPDALACAAGNLRAAGLEAKLRVTLGDATRVPLDGVSAAFADPSRRRGPDRIRSTAEYSPPLASLLARARELPESRLCVKVAPGIDLSDPSIKDALGDAALEAEFISERGTCKEAALWCGTFARDDGARRATAIDTEGAHVFDGDRSVAATVSPVQAFVGEPDPALIRAGLIGAFSSARHWHVLDRRVAYLTTDMTEPSHDPFVRWYRVRDAMDFGVKRIREYLRERTIGRLVVKTRAFPLKPDEMIALLKPRGPNTATLIVTTIQEKKTAIVCDPCRA
ncbi:MAG TPA: methyltransferase domain-containing protein [Candidatus Eremiobacteraceae bacterium]|nr:methyltransferase domain-containing protein [Candidatus Eremiobacteraceae bacterium]